MKLTIILSIKENHDQVAQLLDQAGVKRFSTIDITGYKKNKESQLLNWFGENSGNAKTNSIMFFCFTTEEESSLVIEKVNQCNMDSGFSFPAHAFVIDVEKNSLLL